MNILHQGTASQDFLSSLPAGWLTAVVRRPPFHQSGLQEVSTEGRNVPRPHVNHLPHEIISHKVLTYVEYRAVSDVFQNIYPPTPLSSQRVCPPPAPNAEGTHSPGGEGDGGSIYWKTAALGLASYNNLSALSDLTLLLSPEMGFLVILCRVYLN